MKKKIVAVICIMLAFALCFAACSKKGKKKGETEFVAKVNGQGIPRGLFFSCFMESIDEVYAESPDNIDFNTFGTEEFFNTISTEKNSEGTVYIDALIDSALDKARFYMTNRELAKADSSWPKDSEIQEARELAEEELSSSYSMYIEYYGYTLDYICYSLYGMPMEDYADLSAVESAVALYNEAYKKGLEAPEAEVKAFYEENASKYKIVTVRHSLFQTEDMTEEEAQAVLEKVQGYVDAYNDGKMSFDELAALSEDPGVEDNDGYYDVVEDNSFVKPFQDWAIAQTAPSEKAEIVETSYGYHIMICTKIQGYDDSDTVKANAEDGYRSNLLNEKINAVKDDGKHGITDKNTELAKKYIKMVITGNFTDPDATPTPEVTATPKPEYNDAPAGDEVLAKVGDGTLWASDYTYFFSDAVSEIITPVLSFDGCETTAERYECLKSFLDTPYPDSETGETYLQRCQNYALELQTQFYATWLMATEAGKSYTDDEITAMNEEIDGMIDEYLAYYGEYYGASTRDEYVDYIMGMNVNEYKRFNEKQSLVSDYATEQIEALSADEEALRAYYEENTDFYRVVSVRHIDILKDGENASSMEEAKKFADTLAAKLKAGDSPAALVLAWSEADDSEYGGLVDITASGSTLGDEINDWAIAQETIGVDTVKIFETEEGVSICYIAGIVTFDEAQGEQDDTSITAVALQDAVKEAYGSEQFQKAIEKYVEDNGLKAENVNSNLIAQKTDKYLTYEEEEEAED